MAKRGPKPPKDTGTVINIRGGAVDEDENADAEEVAELDRIEGGELFRALDEIRTVTGARVEVYRLEPNPGFCANYPVSLFSMEKVASDWGPGKYKIRFKGDKNRYIEGGGSIDIAAPLTPATGGAAAGGGSGVADVLAIIKAERESSQNKWWDLLKSPLGLAVAPKLIELVFGGSKGPTLTELMSVISGAKDFHKPAPAQTMETQLEQFARVLAIARDIGGEGTKDSTGATWVDLLRDGINKVPELVGSLRGGIPLTGPLLPAPAPPPGAGPGIVPTPPALLVPAAPANGASSPASESANMDLRMLPWLKGTLEQLLVQATNDRDPDMYAAVTADNLPNYVAPATLLAFLERPNWWQIACAQDARLAGYVGWFKAYHEALLQILQADRASSPPPPGPQPTYTPDGPAEEF